MFDRIINNFKYILIVISFLLILALMIFSFKNFGIIYLKITSIALNISLTLNIGINIYFIKHVNKIDIQNSANMEVCEVHEIDIKHNEQLYIDKFVNNNLLNPDDDIMKICIALMDEFEWLVKNGGFTLDSKFSLDVLEKPEILRRSIDTAKFKCKDEKLNQYLQTLKGHMLEMSDATCMHSFSSNIPGYNEMRWVSIQRELMTGSCRANKQKINQEREAYYKGTYSLENTIKVYDEMIDYWEKYRKAI